MPHTNLPEPRIEAGRAMRIAGLCERYPYSDCSGIPAQWERLRPWLGAIPGAVPDITWGVCCATGNPGLLDYYAGVELEAARDVPPGLRLVEVPAQDYAKFGFDSHISTLPGAVQAIWSDWVPAARMKAGHGPSLERYGAEFDPVTGEGGYEIWLPVEH